MTFKTIKEAQDFAKKERDKLHEQFWKKHAEAQYKTDPKSTVIAILKLVMEEKNIYGFEVQMILDFIMKECPNKDIEVMLKTAEQNKIIYRNEAHAIIEHIAKSVN